MAFIKVPGPDEADGFLKERYEDASKRGGNIAHIVSVQGNNPDVLRSSMVLYRDLMFGKSPLSRAQREMIATVASRVNDCRY